MKKIVVSAILIFVLLVPNLQDPIQASQVHNQPASQTITLYMPLIEHKAFLPSEMASIPAGTFNMGCDPSHNGGFPCEENELPLHEVYLDHYWIDKYETTNLQYFNCQYAGVCASPSSGNLPGGWMYYLNDSYFDFPVIWVDWNQANAYCTWIGKRLPTEAEWEKAARGTEVIAYPWGDDPFDYSLANGRGDAPRKVGNYPLGVSPYGVYEMAGNVSEWVNDWFSPDYYASSPAINPAGPDSGEFKVARGGGWGDEDSLLRTASREPLLPGATDPAHGFRCAMTDDQAPDTPSNPAPASGSTGLGVDVKLSWTASDPDGDQMLYDVYLEAGNPNPERKVASNLLETTFNPGILSPTDPSFIVKETHYYWKVVARDLHGATTTSPVWDFETIPYSPLPEDMVVVPRGLFTMGCEYHSLYYENCDSPEEPAHSVFLDLYWIDKYEITNAQYAACEAAGACTSPHSVNSWTRFPYYSDPTYASYPVIWVDWNQADAYCTWAGKHLPTEAQWEKAARGTTEFPKIYTFPWGEADATCSLANFRSNEGPCIGDTTAVGSYPAGASPYGVYDMAGNVSEWVNDWWEYYSASGILINPMGPENGDHKVVRGGDWSEWEWNIKTWHRDWPYPEISNPSFGFRCAVNP